MEINVQHLASPLIKERMQDVKKLVVGTVLAEKCLSSATEAGKLRLSFSTTTHAMVLATWGTPLGRENKNSKQNRLVFYIPDFSF